MRDATGAVQATIRAGVPAEAIAVYARWWQLERWLRDLAYISLRAKWGATWRDNLEHRVLRYAANDSLVHLRAPDNSNPLAYLDFGLLKKLIVDEWSLFEPYLPPKGIWDGWANELGPIRNRIGHARRGHRDDRSRLEQFLRDLEPGFDVALAAVSTRALSPEEHAGELVARSFYSGALRDEFSGPRLKFGLEIHLMVSKLPWAEPTTGISGTEGAMWNLEISTPSYALNLDAWSSAIASLGDSVIYAFTSSPFGTLVSVPAVDEPAYVIATMKAVMHAYVASIRTLERLVLDAWDASIPFVDSRVLVDHPLAVVPELQATGTVFGV